MELTENAIDLLQLRIRRIRLRRPGEIAERPGSRPRTSASLVFVGATVKLRDVETGSEDLYRLVGDASGHIDEDWVEVTPNSPLGEALMKARVGEVVRVTLRRGPKRFEIVEIVG